MHNFYKNNNSNDNSNNKSCKKFQQDYELKKKLTECSWCASQLD